MLVADGMARADELAAALRARGIDVVLCDRSVAESAAASAVAMLVEMSHARRDGWLAGLRRRTPLVAPLVACEASQLAEALALLDGDGEAIRLPLDADEVAARLFRLIGGGAGRAVADVLAHVAQGFYLLGPDLRLRMWNDKAVSLLGYPPGLLRRGRHYRDILGYNFDRGMFGDGDREAFLDAVLAPEALRAPFQVQFTTGAGIVVNIQRAILPDGGIVLTYTDVTEAKRAEAALRDSERRFRSIVQNSPVPAAIVRVADGGTLFLNPAAKRQIADYRARGQIDDTTTLAPLWQEALSHVVPGDDMRNPEVALRAADGSELWFLSAVSQVSYDGSLCLFAKWFDITEMKRSRAALELSEANLAEAQRIAQVGSWQHDLVRDEVTWSANYYALLGLAPSAPPSYGTILSLLHPADAIDYDAYFLAAMRDGDSGQREYRIVRPDGSVRTLRTVFRVDRDSSGTATRVAGTTQDITDLRATETALQESEARLRQASGLANLGHWVWDARTDRCKFCSPEHARIHGLTAEQYMENAATLDGEFRLVHPEDRPWVKGLYVALRHGEPFDVQYRIVTPSGEVRHLHEIAMPVFDDDGRVIEEYGVAQDITQLLTTERALAESEARFRAVIDQSPVAFALTDRDGRLQMVNRAYEKTSHHDAAWLTGKRWDEALLPETARRVQELDARVLASGAAAQIELALQPPGEANHTLITAFPIRNADGKTVGVGHLGVDLTAQRLAEARLRQSQKMEAVGQMTGGVAHDFNNLLTAVIGNLDLLRLRLENDPDALPLIDTAVRAAERGGRLTQQLLAFSRKQVLAPVPTDLNQVVANFLPLARASLRSHHNLETRLGTGLPTVLVDRAQLDAALLNLVINARDALPAGGRIVIETSLQAPGAGVVGTGDIEAGPYAAIAVRDNGDGMNERTRSQAVEPFFTTKPVGQGSGLGLSMVYGFVEQSGGHLAIRSAPRKGTTVRLFLPAADGATVAAPSARHLPGRTPRGSETVLVVEDDPDVRRFVITVLSGLGYTVLRAKDGAWAARMMAAHTRIDLLLTDVMLPGGRSGEAVAAQFRAQFPAGRVLFTSGHSDEQPRGAADADTLLHKPYRIDTLAARVRAVLDEP